jgi:hypothetical protein
MKFTLTVECDEDCHPCDVAIALENVSKRLSRDFNGDSVPVESHSGKVKLDGWLANIRGEWLYQP